MIWLIDGFIIKVNTADYVNNNNNSFNLYSAFQGPKVAYRVRYTDRKYLCNIFNCLLWSVCCCCGSFYKNQLFSMFWSLLSVLTVIIDYWSSVCLCFLLQIQTLCELSWQPTDLSVNLRSCSTCLWRGELTCLNHRDQSEHFTHPQSSWLPPLTLKHRR